MDEGQRDTSKAFTVDEWGCLQLNRVFCDLGSESWQSLSKG